MLAALARDLRRGFAGCYRIMRAASGEEGLDLLRDFDAAATRSPCSSLTTAGQAPEHRVVVDHGDPHGIAAIRTATDGAEGRENPRP